MDYIVLDLEWNQSSEEHEEEKKALPFEVIEIGAVKMNHEKKMIGQFNKLIKPQVYLQMHPITKKLINLQMEELQHERYFVDIMSDFLEWCGEDYIFCTWGPLDLIELQRNMKYYNMSLLSDGPFPFLDIQKLFSIEYEDKKLRRTLEFAVDHLNIEKDIPFHRAFSDAYYTAKVFSKIEDSKIEKNISYDSFTPPKNKKSEIKINFDHYAKYISREFNDKQEALADKEVSSTKCYLCHKNLRKKIRWFSTNGKHYLSVSYCDKHGPMKAKIRLKKSENNKIYVVKTLKFIKWDDVIMIKNKKSKMKDYKKQKKDEE